METYFKIQAVNEEKQLQMKINIAALASAAAKDAT